ncbi:MAG: GIY-YIG nuclease family protein [Verrucomicrobia bacterium]|nr:GIY-YIG nuclease family protein [Verrucomicrobiota bacterium]MDE3099860.1 GIY-YIG nuclease family protein [Verrucomicrobiota bacterium]
MIHYVYILCLRNNQLYVGSTEDLGRRFSEHRAGSACRTTAHLRPVELIYSEAHPDRSSAIKRERQIKRWSRAKKIALVNGNWTELKRLPLCRTTGTRYRTH